MADHRVCSIEDCGKPLVKRGWCEMHYMRWVRLGDPLRSLRKEARLASAVPPPQHPLGTKLIPLTRGLFAIVDEEDFDRLNAVAWRAQAAKSAFYAGRHCGTSRRDHAVELMHRIVIGAQPGEYVDHINGNPLDNRKCNLRVCTQADNSLNHGGHKKQKSSRFKGVHAHQGKWVASLRGKYLGIFDHEEDAARAYDRAAFAASPEFAWLNFRDGAS